MKTKPGLSWGLGLFVLSIGFFSWLNSEQAPASVQGDSVAMGRAVYVSEGCIHCHSQYIRPVGPDNELWGPLTAPEMALRQQPVLIGNRRQGPDLANVALRRSRDWNQRHLIDPGEVTPGSRMPAYAHLFEGTGERGAALLDYLDQLGPSLKSD